jgi:hypothetical protein
VLAGIQTPRSPHDAACSGLASPQLVLQAMDELERSEVSHEAVAGAKSLAIAFAPQGNQPCTGCPVVLDSPGGCLAVCMNLASLAHLPCACPIVDACRQTWRWRWQCQAARSC